MNKIPSYKLVEQAHYRTVKPLSMLQHEEHVRRLKRDIAESVTREAYDWIAKQTTGFDYMVGVPNIEETRTPQYDEVEIRATVNIYMQGEYAQPEPRYGAYVLKEKNGVPTKVQILDKEYALLPPAIGKGKKK